MKSDTTVNCPTNEMELVINGDIIFDKKLSSEAKVCLLMLAFITDVGLNDTNRKCVSNKKLAEYTGQCIRTVSRHIDELKSGGYINKKRVPMFLINKKVGKSDLRNKIEHKLSELRELGIDIAIIF